MIGIRFLAATPQLPLIFQLPFLVYPKSKLLLTFILRPETKQDTSKTSISLQMVSSSPPHKKKGVICKLQVGDLDPSEPTSKRLTTSWSIALSTVQSKASTTRVKRNGDNGSPGLIPLEPLNFPLGLPLIITE